MKFCPVCTNIYADEFQTCPRDQAALQMLPRPKSSAKTTVLIVMGIVGAIFVAGVLVIGTLAIPQLKGVKMVTDRTSAVASLKAIEIAEIQYTADYPTRGYSCTLAALGGDPAAGSPRPEAAQVLDPVLALGTKNGYQFIISDCSKVKVRGQEMVTGYQVRAVPIIPGNTGDRGFCMDQDGLIKFDPKGGTNCTETLQ